MKDLTVKKTPLWGKIAVTLLSLLTFAVAVGYALSLALDWFVIPGCVTVWNFLFGNDSLRSILTDLLTWNGNVFVYYLYDMPPSIIFIEMILEWLWNCLWDIVKVGGHLLVVAPCLLLPVHAWILSKKRWGSMVPAVAFLLSGVGFFTLFVCYGEGVLRQEIGLLLEYLVYHVNPMIQQMVNIFLKNLIAYLPILMMALTMLLLAVLSFFGMRPKAVSVLGLLFSFGNLGVCVTSWGWSLFVGVQDYIHWYIQDVQVYGVSAFDWIQWQASNIGRVIGGSMVTLHTFALFAGVLLTVFVFVISTRMPGMIGKKRS